MHIDFIFGRGLEFLSLAVSGEPRFSLSEVFSHVLSIEHELTFDKEKKRIM